MSMPAIVGVKKGKIVATGMLDTHITGRRHPAIILRDISYLCPCHTPKPRDHLPGAIGRAIIDHDHFKTSPGLVKNGTDGFR